MKHTFISRVFSGCASRAVQAQAWLAPITMITPKFRPGAANFAAPRDEILEVTGTPYFGDSSCCRDS